MPRWKKQGYFDGLGVWREPDENYFDHLGVYRSPDDEYFDGVGSDQLLDLLLSFCKKVF